MRNRIRHNYPSPIQCLWAFHILIFAKLLLLLLLLQSLWNFYCYYCQCYHYYHTTLLLIILLQILSLSGVVGLTTQLLILENILWLPLCRINKFVLNTVPSKTVVIPYNCGLSMHITISLASSVTNELVAEWCIMERVKRLSGNEIETRYWDTDNRISGK